MLKPAQHLRRVDEKCQDFRSRINQTISELKENNELISETAFIYVQILYLRWLLVVEATDWSMVHHSTEVCSLTRAGETGVDTEVVAAGLAHVTIRVLTTQDQNTDNV